MVILGRLKGPGASSSEAGSGAARFFPLMSLGGSLMVRAVVVAVVRRDLGESESVRIVGCVAQTNRLVARPSSWESLFFALRLARWVDLDDVLASGGAADDEDCSAAVVSRSGALPLSFDLFFAVFALVLERRDLASAVVVSSAWSRADELEALASCCWGNVKSI